MKCCFKPCYKWNAFNTKNKIADFNGTTEVLNLIITGIPSIPANAMKDMPKEIKVLNLVISGIPSILKIWRTTEITTVKF